MKLDALDLQLSANLQGNFEEGWRLSQILEKERPADNRAAFNRGWHYLRNGDLQKGFELIDRGRLEEVFGSPAVAGEQWDGKKELQGKTVLLRGEGGFGDEIINVRFAKLLADRGAQVVVSCHSALVSLFSRVSGVGEVIPHGAIESARYDYWVPAMSAARWLGLTYETLPGGKYLSANPEYAEKWKKIVTSQKLKVGIRWSGNPKFEHEQHRKFPPEQLIDLHAIKNVQLYSLQRDNDIRDLPDEVIDLQHDLETFEDTAAAIERLDLVITSCTVTAHLAAALGKETWVIVPVLPYYLWALPGEKSPWYKSVRLFRQEQFGNWDKPLHTVRAMLEDKARTEGKSISHKSIEVPPNATQSTQPPPMRPFVPGMYFAPQPTPSQISDKKTSAATVHFVGGLPRTGATVLMSLLAQNPRIFSAPISGLCGMFSGVFANWEKSERHREMPNVEAKKRVLRGVIESYHDTERPVILDKDRMWVLHLARLEEILERPVKVIVTVRPLPEILASFEILRRKNALELSAVDEALGGNSTAASRAAYYAGDQGPLGMSYNALKDAVVSGYLDRMLFVDYNKLMSAPKMQLRRIYDFLEEPHFEHDLQKIEQVASGKLEGFAGLHDIRSELKKTSASAREVLGPEVFNQYNQPEPWSLWT